MDLNVFSGVCGGGRVGSDVLELMTSSPFTLKASPKVLARELFSYELLGFAFFICLLYVLLRVFLCCFSSSFFLFHFKAVSFLSFFIFLSFPLSFFFLFYNSHSFFFCFFFSFFLCFLFALSFIICFLFGWLGFLFLFFVLFLISFFRFLFVIVAVVCVRACVRACVCV